MTVPTPPVLDHRLIAECLPHRYPFLLVDRVLSLEPMKEITALKNVTINEPFFQGHFPGAPVMPGVLIMEALAQAGGVLMIHSCNVDPKTTLFLFTGLNNVRFRKPVLPGDQLILRCTEFKQRMRIARMRGEALVDCKVVAEGVLSAATADRSSL